MFLKGDLPLNDWRAACKMREQDQEPIRISAKQNMKPDLPMIQKPAKQNSWLSDWLAVKSERM